MLALLTSLRWRGALPDAIGLQSHTGGWTDHAAQSAVYDALAAAGLPIHVTEFWAHTKQLAETGRYAPEQLDEIQADYVANYLTTAFGHPAIEAFFFWGFMGSAIRWGEHSSHELKPLYHRVRRLLHEEWSTQERLTTDAAGCVRFRGFHGDYALRYALPGGVRTGWGFRVDRQQSMPLTVIACPLPDGGLGP
jgi:GH35 family endo-1,4-beta-xylanase